MKRVWVVLSLIFIIAIIIFSVKFFNLKQNEKILVQNKTAKIVFTTDKTYQDYLKVTIKSAIENKNADSIYDISILSVDLSTEEMQYFKNMSAKNVTISTIPLEVSSLKVGNFPIANKRVSRADLFKFFMPEIFEDCDRILYIDSDTLILGDLLDLYNTNMHGKCLGAVIKYVPKYSWIKIIPRIWYVKSVKYDYNCGVMLMDLKQMRKYHITEKLIKAKNTDNNRILMTQDAFNTVIPAKKSYHLSPVYNFITRWRDRDFKSKYFKTIYAPYLDDVNSMAELQKQAIIVHYAGIVKPWNTKGVRFETQWWKYAKMINPNWEVKPELAVPNDSIIF